jgi:hypothetical protein
MNTGMDPESMLRRFRLREPSAGVREKIDRTTRGEWVGKGIAVEFNAVAWRLVASLAASVLIILGGNVVNNVMVVRNDLVQRNGPVAAQPVVDADIPHDLIGARLATVLSTEAGIDGFIRMREVLRREMGESGKKDNASLPQKLMYDSRKTGGLPGIA